MICCHPWIAYDERHPTRSTERSCSPGLLDGLPEGGLAKNEQGLCNHVMADPDNGAKGFKITDRRKFTADGAPRPEAEETSGSESTPTHGAGQARPVSGETGRRESAEARDRGQVGPPAEVHFLDLVEMLATNAFVQLGDLPEPASGERVDNLPGAQIMIGLLDVVREKTKGNLTAEEEKVLADVLYNLRMRFMARANLIKR